jgi:hypothetical protein
MNEVVVGSTPTPQTCSEEQLGFVVHLSFHFRAYFRRPLAFCLLSGYTK